MGTNMTVQDSWDNLLPSENAEAAALFYLHRGSFKGISYKDLHAQAHCAAGWFMRQGLQKGDRVGVLTGLSPEHLVLDLAFQYLGAVQILIPDHLSRTRVADLAKAENIRFLYVHTGTQLEHHNQFLSLKPQLHSLIINTNDADANMEAIDPEKVVTFDRVVTHGKAAWREDVAELEEMKKAVGSQDIFVVLADEHGNGKGKAFKFQDLLGKIKQASDNMQAPKEAPAIIQLPTHRLLQRSHLLAALAQRRNVYLCAQPEAEDFSSVQPSYLLLEADELHTLYTRLPSYLGKPEAEAKKIAAAHTVLDKRDEAAAQGKKNPFMNGLRYKTGNKKLYGRIRTKLGGRLAGFIAQPGHPDPQARRLFDECGFQWIMHD
ncbi:MAG: AMP-binding protein [Bacteroidota bacterium]